MGYLLTISLLIFTTATAYGQSPCLPESVVREAFAGREGALVVVDSSSGTLSTFGPQMAAKRLAPCSTFKIWNTLIGLECGILSSPDQAFYQWDGEKRSIAAWNRDLTLLEAFQASCVPGFQNLARQIGADRMQSWIDRIEYGNRDTSAGVDLFWLPARSRTTILISPTEQAQLTNQLITGKLPFSQASFAVLKKLMTVSKTEKGFLFGKTGSGSDDRGAYVLGWFVGFVESKGKTYVFACAAQGENIMSKDARAIVESVFKKQGLL